MSTPTKARVIAIAVLFALAGIGFAVNALTGFSVGVVWMAEGAALTVAWLSIVAVRRFRG
ncbi:hypothetical protein GCM10010449_85370 [Streptomyces rectiviolaceus]|uniref:DUF1328 domain-containing protein n=1 Tax=Streptomyces rectiviolaceus TaxID=332591 RepID=A0ABP6NSX9_9ACTN